MAADGSIIIDTRLDTRGFNKTSASMQKSFGNLGASVKKLGGLIAGAFAVKHLVEFGKEAIQLGSDLQEVQNVVDTTFTTMSDKVNEFAQSAAASAGLSETMAKRYAGTFGAMAKSFKFTEAEMYEMSTSLTQLSGDIASFYNISQDEAYTKLKSVFTGETETLKELGVVMTQNALDSYAMAKGYGKTTKAMTEQEKVALRYAFVMDQLSAASGDFLRTSDSWANQTRVLALQFDSLKATIGQGLINLLTPAVKLLNTLIGKLQVLADAFKSFTEMLTGNKATESSTAGLEEIADATNDVTEATEEAEKAQKGYLSGLDEIKHFSDGSDSSASAGIDLGSNATQGSVVDNEELSAGVTIFDGLIDKAKELADIFKTGFLDGFGDSFANFDNIKVKLQDIATEIKNIFSPDVQASANAFVTSFINMIGTIAGSIASIGTTIATNLVTGLQKYLKKNSGKIQEYLKKMFDIGTILNDLRAELWETFADIFSVFGGENATNLTANIIQIFSDAFMGVTETIGTLVADIASRIVTGFTERKEEIKSALDETLGGLADIFGSLSETVQLFTETILPDLVENIQDLLNILQPIFDFIGDTLMDIWTEWLNPALDYLGNELIPDITDTLEQLWNDVLSPAIDFIKNVATPVIELIAGYLKEFWENILKPLGKAIGEIFVAAWEALVEIIQKKVIPKWQKIVEVFQFFWDKVGKPLVDWFKDNFLETIKNVFGNIKDLIGNIKNIFIGIINFIKNVFLGNWKEAWQNVKDIFANIFEGLGNILKVPINGVIGFLNALIDGIARMVNWIGEMLNSLSFDIPDWDWLPDSVQGASLGFNFGTWTPGQIPYLAKGAVIPPNAPFTAVLGDQRHGNNLEAPEDLIRKIVREESGGNGSYTFVGQINRRVLFEEFIEEAKLRQQLTGNNPLNLA